MRTSVTITIIYFILSGIGLAKAEMIDSTFWQNFCLLGVISSFFNLIFLWIKFELDKFSI
jgi:hypothetical protein